MRTSNEKWQVQKNSRKTSYFRELASTPYPLVYKKIITIKKIILVEFSDPMKIASLASAP